MNAQQRRALAFEMLTRERDEARTACAGLFALIESGVLVRDISHDSDPKWYLKAMELTQALLAAKAVIEDTPKEKRT